MKTRIIDNWEVELTNDKGDILTLKGQWYADFFKEYENKQLIIANVVGQSKQLVCDKCNSERINANDLEYVAASENSQKVDLDHFVEWYETRFGFKLSEWGIAEYKKWEIPKQTD